MPVVVVSLLQGRTEEQKQKVAEAITKAMAEHAKSSAKDTHVIFQEYPASSWAMGGSLLSIKPFKPS